MIFQLLLGLLTSLSMTLSFPDFDYGWLAWFALIPLLLAIRNTSATRAFFTGLVSGIGSAYGIFAWLFNVAGFNITHFSLLAVYFAFYTAIWSSGIVMLKNSRIPLILTAPSLWAVLDYARAHMGFLSVPWASLAHSQHYNLPLLQIATLTGEYGVTFLVVMSNVTIFLLITDYKWRQAILTFMLLGVLHIWGYYEISRDLPTQTVSIAVVQPSISFRERTSAEGRSAVMERLRDLTMKAAAQKPVLVIWPETAVHQISTDSSLQNELIRISSEAKIPILTGSSDFAKLPRATETGTLPGSSYNSAFLISSDRSIGEPYRKHILVPFAEYLPLESTISWPSWLVPRMFNVIPGNEDHFFSLEDGRKFSVIICWENMFPDYIRRAVRRGSCFIAHLANDFWFGHSAAARQHNLASVLRAVEHRIPVVVSSNTGPSQIINPFGKVAAEVPELFKTGFIVAKIPATPTGTFYSANGDLAVLGMVFIIFVAFIIVTVHIIFNMTKNERR